MLKVSCAIIPDYSPGKWTATTVQCSVKVVILLSSHSHLWLSTYEDTGSFFHLPTLLFTYSLQTKSKPHPCDSECVSVWVCVSGLSLISTWACCLLLRCSGSENKQSSSYLAWAGKVDSAEQAAPGVRGGQAGVDTGQYQHTLKYGVNMEESRAKANSWEKASKQSWILNFNNFSCVLFDTKRWCLNDCGSQGRPVLLLATCEHKSVLVLFLCGATGEVFRCRKAKESWRCCSWSSHWG